MARYSISDTTLTALGDAIRNHVGETEYRDISTLSMPYRVNNRVNNGAAAYAPIPVCGATTIQLRRTGDSDNYATMYTQYCDANVLFPGTNEALITLRNFTNSTCGLYMITANDVTYEAEITWYDADGNQMEPLVPMEVPNTMTPENMADRINALTLLDPRLLLIDTLNYKFYNGCWDVFLENYGDKMTFPEPVSSAISTFYNSSIKTIPFEIPGYAVNTFTVTNMCQMAKYLEAPPIFHNIKIGDMTSMFDGCESLREFPEGYGEDWDWSYHTTATTTYSGNKSSLLKNCYSLRKLPMALFKYGNPKSDYSYHALRDFDGLYALDEVDRKSVV